MCGVCIIMIEEENKIPFECESLFILFIFIHKGICTFKLNKIKLKNAMILIQKTKAKVLIMC